MNKGLYPGTSQASLTQSEGFPLIGQAVEMGYTLNNFTVDGKEFLRSGVTKLYSPKYSTFYNRNPYACSAILPLNLHYGITSITNVVIDTAYINTANGYHYLIPLEASNTTYDGIHVRYGTAISSISTSTTIESTAVATRAVCAIPYGTSYVAVSSSNNTSSNYLCFFTTTGAWGALAPQQIAGATGLFSLASNGSTSILGISNKNINISQSNGTLLKKWTSAANSLPGTNSTTAVTVVSTPSAASMLVDTDCLMYLSSATAYLMYGAVSNGSGGYNVTVWKSTDVGSNWSLLYNNTEFASSTASSEVSTFRARRNSATNGSSMIIVPAGSYISGGVIWTDGTTSTLVDISSFIPYGYTLANSSIVYDQSSGLYVLSFSTASTGGLGRGSFILTSPNGKNWTPRYNLNFLGRSININTIKASGSNVIALVGETVNSSNISGYINVAGYLNLSTPKYINYTNPTSGNNLSTFYRIL